MTSSFYSAIELPALTSLRALPHWLARIMCTAMILLSGVWLTGCSSAAAPTFKVLGANVREKTDQSFVLEFLIEADNSNPEPLPLRDVTYSVQVEGLDTFTGTRYPEVILRRYGRQEFLLPASFELKPGQSLPQQPTYNISGTIIYLAPGAFSQTLFEQSLIKPTSDFSGTGTFNFAQ